MSFQLTISVVILRASLPELQGSGPQDAEHHQPGRPGIYQYPRGATWREPLAGGSTGAKELGTKGFLSGRGASFGASVGKRGTRQRGSALAQDHLSKRRQKEATCHARETRMREGNGS